MTTHWDIAPHFGFDGFPVFPTLERESFVVAGVRIDVMKVPTMPSDVVVLSATPVSPSVVIRIEVAP